MRRVGRRTLTVGRRGFAALAAGILVALYVPGLIGGSIPCFRDLLSHHLWWHRLAALSLAHGRLPWIDPAMGAGAPLLADPNTMALYPSTLLFAALPPALALTLHLLLHHLLLALGSYLFLRRLGRLDRAALAGAVFAAGAGLAVSQLAFANAIAVLAWAPWLAWTAVRLPEEGRGLWRRAAAAACFGALSFLAGEPVLSGISWLVWALALVTGNGWSRRWITPRLRLAAAPLLALALAAPLLLPAAAIHGESERRVLGLAHGSVAADAFLPRRWVEPLLPHLFGTPGPFAPDGSWAYPSFGWLRYEVNLHLGTIPLALLLLAGWNRRNRLWTAAALGATFLAAAPGLLAAAGRVLPALGELRYGIKLLVLAQLALVPVIARAASAARVRPGAFRRRAAVAGGLLVAVGLPLAAPSSARAVLSRLYPASASNLARSGVSESVAASVRWDLAMGLIPLAAAAVAPSALLLPALVGQMALGGASMLIWDDPAYYLKPPAMAAAIGRDPRLVEAIAFPFDRLHPPLAPTEPAPVNRSRLGAAQLWRYYGALHGIRYRGEAGPDGMVPWRVADCARRLAGTAPERLARAARQLGAARLLLKAELPDAPDIDRVLTVRAGGVQLHLHRLHRPPPRAWLARREIIAGSRDAGWQLLLDAAVTPGRDAVVPGQRPDVQDLEEGLLELMQDGPSRWRIAVQSPGPGLLVLDQAYSRQWRASTGGEPLETVPVNLWQLGVRFPAGRHEITVTWDHGPLFRGVAAAAAALLIILLLLVGSRPRRRRRTPSGVPAPRSPASPPAP